MKTLVVIPAHNAQTTLDRLLTETRAYTDSILVVDDGSRDDTFAIAKSHEVESIKHPSNLGLSKAMQTAFAYGAEFGFTHILTIDSDLQHPPRYIPDFLEVRPEIDLVHGSRFRSPFRIPSAKIASNLFASCVFEMAFGTFVSDTSCGYRRYRVEAFMNMHFGQDYEFIYHSLAHAIGRKMRVAQRPVAAVYPEAQLLSTRRTELMNLFSACTSSLYNSPASQIAEQVANKEDFHLQYSGMDFYGYYLARNSTYLLQCDVNAAIDTYSKNEDRNLHTDL